MKVKSHKKNIIITICVIVGVFAVILAILLIKRDAGGSTVNVYAVSSLAMRDFDEDRSESYGEVKCEGFQNITLTDTQTVKKIYVKEGQEVKKGDLLLDYDTTLSDLDVEKAELEMRKAELALTTAQNELYEINCLVPHYEVLIKPKNTKIKYKKLNTPYLISGKGTKSKPMYWVVDEEDEFDDIFFSQIMPKGKNEVYVVLLIREHNAINGEILEAFGLYVRIDGASFTVRPYSPSVPGKIAKADIPAEPYYEEYGSDYDAAEIAEMRAEKEAEISDLEIQLKVASLEYEKQQKEVSDSAAYAKEDGIVRTVRKPDKAYREGLPVVEISSGGGYYIDVYLNELELDAMSVGDKVSVNTYSSGVSCEGEIVNISMFPVTNADSYSYGNTNVSYYPFTVFVSDDAGLTEGEYASVTYSAKTETDTALYIENMFIRKEKGEAYVYAEGADRKLEKRLVQTGKSLWGSYTEIKNGLAADDHIAFPYGKDVKEGTAIAEADLSELYGW